MMSLLQRGLCAAIVMAAGVGTASAQGVIVYPAPPVVSYYAPAPVPVYAAPTPVLNRTTYYGPFGRPRSVSYSYGFLP